MIRLKYQILGSLQVSADGSAMKLGGMRSRRILATLLVHSNRVVSTDRIIEAAWGDACPETARRQAQNRVAILRTQLAPLGAELSRHPTGYQLTVAADELDASLFDQLVLAARGCGRPEEGSRLLREALALWRGPALDGLDSAALAPEAYMLNEQRLRALGDYVDLELAIGRHEEVIPELTKARSTHPLRERFLIQWMRAVAAAGRLPDAVEAYQDFRARHVEELGLEPGEGVRRAYHDLLRYDTAGPTAGGSDDAPAAPALPRQLPRANPSFVGRRQELSKVCELLGESGGVPVVVIHGAGGVGKTTLALQAAHRVADRFPDGQLYADLLGFTPGQQSVAPTQVLGRFLRALGTPSRQVPTDPHEMTSLFRTQTAGRRILVVLDNARDASQILPCIPGEAHCAVLVTSRRTLRTVEGAGHVRLGLLSKRDAIAQLAKAAGEHRVAADPEAAAEIARYCAYMPLALRIATARLHSNLSLRALADRLADTPHRLDHLELPENGVRTSISISTGILHDSSDPNDKLAERTFLLLSLLDGQDVSQPVAQRMVGEPPMLVDHALDHLVDANLLDPVEPGRFAMHDLLRLYGRERMGETPAGTAALNRAFGVYTATAWNAAALIRPGDVRLDRAGTWWQASALTFSSEASAMAWAEKELGNIMATLRQAATSPTAPATVPIQLAMAMFGFFRIRGHWDYAVEAAARGADIAARSGDRWAEARLLGDLAAALVAQRKLTEAVPPLRTAMFSQRNIGDRAGLAQSLCTMGVLHYSSSHLDDALACYRKSLSLHRELRNLRGQAMALDNMGPIYRMKRRYDRALECHQQALANFRHLNDSYGQAVALFYLGELYRETGRHEEGTVFAKKSVEIYRHMGDFDGETRGLRMLGGIYRSQCRNGEALEVYEAALAVCEQHALVDLAAELSRDMVDTVRAIGRAPRLAITAGPTGLRNR